MHCYYWDFAIWPFTSPIMISYWDLYRSRRNPVIDTCPSTAFITPPWFVRGSPGITSGLGWLGCNTSPPAEDSGARACTGEHKLPSAKWPGTVPAALPELREAGAGQQGDKPGFRDARGRQRPARRGSGSPGELSVALRRQVRQKTCVSLRA